VGVTRVVTTEAAAVDEDHHPTTMRMTTTATRLEETELDHTPYMSQATPSHPVPMKRVES
jgi:hypothetical protein